MSKPYVDKTGTDQKPDPMRDVYLEFPRAMMEIAKVTAYGATKHPPRGWQTFEPRYGTVYHRSKVGRHLLKEETEGLVNHEDGGLLHPAQTVWNMLAYLENILKLQEPNKPAMAIEQAKDIYAEAQALTDAPLVPRR
jgi:hypothetical protein